MNDKLYTNFPNLAPTPATNENITNLLESAKRTVDANHISGEPFRGNGSVVGDWFGSDKSVYCLIVGFEYHLMLGQTEYITRDESDAHRAIVAFVTP